MRYFIFFSPIFCYTCFNKTFVKNFMKKMLFFNTSFQNSFKDVLYYRILTSEKFWH